MAVDRIAAHADRIRCGLLFAQLVFSHDNVADHAPCFADVELVGPVAIVSEFILRQAPFFQLVLHLLRHARVIGDEPEKALLVGSVLGDDLLAALVAGLGVIVVVADVIKAEWAVVVRVRFVIRDGVKFLEELAPAGVQHTQQQLILTGIVPFGFWKGDAIAGIIGVAGAEAVSLHALVTAAELTRRLHANAWKHTAFGITRYFVGADGLLHGTKVVAMMQHADLDAVVLFTIDAVGFTSDVILHTSCGHEVALIGGVDEHFTVVSFTAERGDGGDLLTLLFHTAFAIQPFITHHFDAVFFDEVFKNHLRSMRLEDPHCAVFTIHGRCALPLVAVFVFLLLHPGLRLLIVHVDAVIKLTRQTTDDGLVSCVRKTEPAAAKAAEMLVRAHNDHGFAHLFHLNGGSDRSTCAAIDDDIMIGSRGKETEGKKAEGKSHGNRIGDAGRYCQRCFFSQSPPASSKSTRPMRLPASLQV